MSAQSEILIEDLSLLFRLYQDKHVSLKEKFSNLLTRRGVLRAKTFWALQHVNLCIRHGERVGIIGHNGAGKSTLLKTICRIYTPTAGRIQVTGSIAPLLEIGAGFQAELSGRENIYLNGAILGYPTDKLRSVEHDVIEFTQLDEFIDTPVKYYSTGMYMKLAFAIATAVDPEILVLDEIFAGGDAEFIGRAQARMDRFVKNSNILVFVSHQPELIRKLCNRVVWLDHGTIIADGPADEILDRYLNKTTGVIT